MGINISLFCCIVYSKLYFRFLSEFIELIDDVIIGKTCTLFSTVLVVSQSERNTVSNDTKYIFVSCVFLKIL